MAGVVDEEGPFHICQRFRSPEARLQEPVPRENGDQLTECPTLHPLMRLPVQSWRWCGQAADVPVAVTIVPGELARHLRITA